MPQPPCSYRQPNLGTAPAQLRFIPPQFKAARSRSPRSDPSGKDLHISHVDPVAKPDLGDRDCFSRQRAACVPVALVQPNSDGKRLVAPGQTSSIGTSPM